MVHSLLSVVVPVYNVRPYLPRCLDSILQQTYRNLEIILVNDGSTDGSGEVLDQYSQMDDRIRVIHQENQGVVAARGAGIRVATGEYIGFVDPDDYIVLDYYKKLMDEMGDADLITCGYTVQHFSGDTEVVCGAIPAGIYATPKQMDYIRKHMLVTPAHRKSGITNNVWAKVFRATLLKKMYSDFCLDVTYGEDWVINTVFMLDANKIVVSNISGYYYVERKSSACHTIPMSTSIFENQSKIYRYLREQFEKSDERDMLLWEVEYMVAACCPGLSDINRFRYHRTGKIISFLFMNLCIKKKW